MVQSRRGFTLVEVLIFLIVVGIIGVVLHNLFSSRDFAVVTEHLATGGKRVWECDEGIARTDDDEVVCYREGREPMSIEGTMEIEFYVRDEDGNPVPRNGYMPEGAR